MVQVSNAAVATVPYNDGDRCSRRYRTNPHVVHRTIALLSRACIFPHMTGVPVKGFFARRRRLAVGPLLPVDRLAASAVGGRALVKAEAAGRRGPTASLYKGPTTDSARRRGQWDALPSPLARPFRAMRSANEDE